MSDQPVPELDLFDEVGKMLVVARRMLRKGPEVLTLEDTEMWFAVLSRAGVKAQDVQPALIRYMEGNEWFPAPAHIIERARKIAADRYTAEMYARPVLPKPEPRKPTMDEEIASAVAMQQSRERIMRKMGMWDEEKEANRTVKINGEPTPLRDLMSAILGPDIHDRVERNTFDEPSVEGVARQSGDDADPGE